MGVAALLALLLVCLQPHSHRFFTDGLVQIRHSVVGVAIVVLFASWLVSSLDSLSVEKSLGTWFRLIGILALLFYFYRMFAAHPDSAERFKKASLVLSVAVLLYIALVLMGWNALFAPIQALKDHPLSTHGFFKSHASTSMVVLPFLIWAGWTLGGVWRWMAGAAVVLTGVLVYGGGIEISKAGLAGFVGAVCAIGFTLAVGTMKRSVSYIFWIAAAAAGVAIAWYVVSHLPVPPFADQMPDLVPFVDSHRELIWGFVLDAHKAVPYFGYGLNTVNTVPGASTVIEALNQEYIPSHPHNWMIEVLAETGWTGYILLLTCIALHLRQVVRALYYNRPAALALVACSGAYWVSGLVNFSFWTSWWQVAYLLALIVPFAALSRR